MFIVLFAFFLLVRSEIVTATVYLKSTKRIGEYEFDYKADTYDEKGVAFARYNPDFYNSGWDYLFIGTNNEKKYSDEVIAAGAGYLEGYINQEMIYISWQNTYPITWSDTNQTIPKYISQYWEQQYDWIEEKAEQNNEEAYWRQLYAVVLQQLYVIRGYNDACPSDKEKLTRDEFECLFSEASGDLVYLRHENRPDFSTMSSEEVASFFLKSTKCSAIVKLTADAKNLFFGHTTWSDPGTMLRTFKEYELNFENSLVKSSTTAFPSYPGVTNSVDDMYSMKETQMISIETTNAVFNTDLYNHLNPHSVPEWVRIILANRLADNGVDWMKYFSDHNDGTYNNQWMVIDLKLFEPGEDLKRNLLVVGEQIPGDFVWQDVTMTLERGYWPSYNVPYFKSIFNATGYAKRLEEHPEMKKLIDYETCVRAQLMRAYQSTIESMEHMEKFIRYNNYVKDPLELGDPGLAIAGRHDLDPVLNRCHMSTDGKVSSYEMYTKENSWRIISGPPYGGESNVPPFTWSTTKNCDLPTEKRIKMPDSFQFDWVTFKGKE